MTIEEFVDKIIFYYREHGRVLPWRTHVTPYRIFISEVMLQQTQVARVLVKFPEFMQAFPDFEHLASAERYDVLKLWQGMGYNRRAKYLHDSAKHIVNEYKGKLPDNPIVLDKLPGIGIATAGSIACFAFNKPAIFIETNIRRTFLFSFMRDKKEVDDREILPILQRCVQIVAKKRKFSYREWYWALMDYGSYLTTVVPNPNIKSKHYAKQSKFEGSDRQMRGVLLKQYLGGRSIRLKGEREKRIWNELVKEGLVE